MREGSPIAAAIAGTITFFFTLLPFLLIFVLFGFFFIYAIVKGSAFTSAGANVPLILIVVAGLVAFFVLLMLAGIGLLGRGLRPARRADAPTP